MPAIATGAALGAAAALVVWAPGTATLAPVALGAAIGVAAFAGSVRRPLLAVVLLDVSLQWDVVLGQRPDVAEMGAIGGWEISLTTIALPLLYAAWMAELLVGTPRATRAPRWAPVLPLLLLTLVSASVVVAADRTVAGFEVFLLAQMVLLFLYLLGNVRTRGDVCFVVAVLLAGALIQAPLALAAYAWGWSVDVAGFAVGPDETTTSAARLAGSLGHPNVAGGYFAFMGALALAVVTADVPRPLRRLAVLAGAASAVALVFSLSRGGWLAMTVALAVVLVGAGGGRGARRTARPAVVVTILAVAVLLVPLQGTVSSRLLGDDRGSAESRVPLMHIAANMVEDRPLLGVGANNFVVALPDYADAEVAGAWLSIVHNRYLVVATQSGLPALAVFVAFLIAAVVRAWRARGSPDPLVAAVGLGLAAALCGHATHMLVDHLESRAMVALLWIAAGVALSPALSAGAMRRRPR